MRLLDSDGGHNHEIPFSSGGIKPPHVKQIGPAYPLFLKFEDMVTTGEGTYGLVLGGRPVRDAELAGALGLHPKTVCVHRQRLAKYGYINTKRTPHGYIIRVGKSKKWALIQARRQPSKTRKVIDMNDSITLPSDGVNLRSDGVNLRSDGAVPIHVEKTSSGLLQNVGHTAAASDAWKALAVDLPLGTIAFQSIWQFLYGQKNGTPLSEAMERCIHRAKQKHITVPRPFYDAKRRVEDFERNHAPTATGQNTHIRDTAKLSDAGAERYALHGGVRR